MKRPPGRPPGSTREKGSTVTSWIPVSLYARLEAWSKETGRSFSDLIREVILEELAKDGGPASSEIVPSRTHVYKGGPPPIRLMRMQFAHERRARLLGIRWAMVDLRRVYARGKGLCGICGQPVSLDEFTIDHIVPVSRGGPHVFANLQPAHPSCNSAKGNR